jgi:hypothetical protein
LHSQEQQQHFIIIKHGTSYSKSPIRRKNTTKKIMIKHSPRVIEKFSSDFMKHLEIERKASLHASMNKSILIT